MAKDASNKTHSSGNFGDTSPTLLDSQKVPPLRIVLNTAAGNQKAPASSTGAASSSQQEQSKASKDKPQDTKGDISLKGGRFRIKLGANRQQQLHKTASSSNSESASKTSPPENEEKQKILTAGGDASVAKEQETSSSSNYLRRITRRSQRSVQVISNEDEESISSMTSTDENQITSINNSDSNQAHDATTSATATQPSSTSTGSSCSTNNAQGTETPRKYKKRRGETSDSQVNEQLAAFGYQHYSVPVQNSFKLFKNIRKQVDRKLDALNNSLQPKAPHGFREYMLAKGAYILDGYRLGNGVNLSINEDGGMNIAPMGKFGSRRLNKVTYYIPERARVPLDIPADSPLKDLFIEQEKERYRMRIQHIKEREKLTLATEQEVMRVYYQAAMASANQFEPLSVCTMLKHQEIYNYMDSDGTIIQANEDEGSQDITSQDGVRTRRRQHDHTSPPQVRKTSEGEENQLSEIKVSSEMNNEVSTGKETDTEMIEKNVDGTKTETISSSKKRAASPDDEDDNSDPKSALKKEKIEPEDEQNDSSEKPLKASQKPTSQENSPELDSEKGLERASQGDVESKGDSQEINTTTVGEYSVKEVKENEIITKDLNELDSRTENMKPDQEELDEKEPPHAECGPSKQNAEKAPSETGPEEVERTIQKEQQASDDDQSSPSERLFLMQLQEIDDKWERIRAEMLIRHKNEAESLHAVQRLEWEWRTKEIGAIDVRSTPVIDSVLVPKLNVYTQDY